MAMEAGKQDPAENTDPHPDEEEDELFAGEECPWDCDKRRDNGGDSKNKQSE